MQVQRVGETSSRPEARRSNADVVGLAAVLAGVTALVFVWQLATDPDDFPPVLNLAWLVLLLTAAPVAAAVLSRRREVRLTRAQQWLVGLPQLFVTVGLVWLDVWLDVRSGYVLAGSGEEAMSYGIGSVVGIVVGLVLTGLVVLGAYSGNKRRPRPSAESPSSDDPS